jgi:hypothetical protein
MKFKEQLKSERGEGIVSALYTMLVLTIILFVGIDIAGYTATSWKLRNACSETLALMKIENGFDVNLEEIFLEYTSIQGLESASVVVTGTPKLVQRGEMVTIRATTPYILKSLRPLDKELHVTIDIEMSGLAQEFIR